MAGALVAFLVFTIGAATARNNDYLGSHMPNYGSDYEGKDHLQSSDEYPERSPDAALSHDYKYEEDENSSIDNKVHVKHTSSNTWAHGLKNKPPKHSNDEDIDQDDYEIEKNIDKISEEHVASKFKPNSRSRKKYNFYDSDIDDKIIDHSRRRINDEYSIDNRGKINLKSGRVEERQGSRGVFSKTNNRFQRRENTGRIPRRKPRDRALSREVLNSDTIENREEKIRLREEDSIEQDYPARRVTIDLEDSPKPSKTPFKNNNAEYDEYFDMKRINRIKDKLLSTTTSRNTKEIVTTTQAASVAERELRALLGHRQRKDIAIVERMSSTLGLPIAFPNRAVDSVMDNEWDLFIKSNRTARLHPSMYITILVLINYLHYYTHNIF